MSNVMLEVKELTTKYVTRFGEDVYAVDHVSLKVEEGKTLGIAGESGCGKSTLALSLMGYYFAPLHYMSGEIIIDGRNISGMKPDDVRKSVLGKEIAYIPQSAMNALNPTRKIIHFIEDVIQEHELYITKKDIYDRARKLFETLGLPAEVLQKYPVELSGGMKQKLALCCALIHEPKILFLDEPTTGVDPVSRKEFWDMLGRLKEKDITIMVSTPYMDEASRCDRVGLIQKGHILDIDTPDGIVRKYKKNLFAVKSDQMFRLLNDLRQYEYTASCFAFGEYLHLSLQENKANINDAKAYLMQKNHSNIIINPISPNIEDTFIALMEEHEQNNGK